jgi:hypothetical protein
VRKRRNRLYITDIKVGDTVVTTKNVYFSNSPFKENIAIKDGIFLRIAGIKKRIYGKSGYYYNIKVRIITSGEQILVPWKQLRKSILTKNK